MLWLVANPFSLQTGYVVMGSVWNIEVGFLLNNESLDLC